MKILQDLYNSEINFSISCIWDGGFDGAVLIRRFINEAPPFLMKNGKILVGINTFYVPYGGY